MLGLRDPSQIVDFALATAKVVDPAGYAEFEAGKQAIGRRLGIDVDEDVLAQLTGDVCAVVSIDGKFGVRAELEDPDGVRGDAREDHGRAARVLRRRHRDRQGGRPLLRRRDRRRQELRASGVAEGALVVANNPLLASEVATRGARGRRGPGGRVRRGRPTPSSSPTPRSRSSGAGSQALGGSLFTGPLGDLLTSASASTDGLTGRLELKIE